MELWIAMLSIVAVMLMLITNVQAQTDVDILNYALTLEHLEYAFYREGMRMLGRFFRPQRFRKLSDIRNNEGTHVDTLISVINSLGGTPVRECKYDFGYKTKQEFLAVARILENVGVSAYLGVAYEINSNALLTAAASIVTVEARHASYLNKINSVNPFPHPFDSPLDRKAIVRLAGGFIVSCPDAISITPYPALALRPGRASRGGSIQVVHSIETVDIGKVYCVFYSSSTSMASLVEVQGENHHCRVPDDANKGDTFVFLMTAQAYSFTDNANVIAGPALFTVI